MSTNSVLKSTEISLYSGFFRFHFSDCVLFSFDWTFTRPPWWKEPFSTWVYFFFDRKYHFLFFYILKLCTEFFSHASVYIWISFVLSRRKESKRRVFIFSKQSLHFRVAYNSWVLPLLRWIAVIFLNKSTLSEYYLCRVQREQFFPKVWILAINWKSSKIWRGYKIW